MNKKTTYNNTKGFKAWIAALVLLGGLATVAGLYWTNNTTVSSISFEGEYFTSEKELRQVVVIPEITKTDSLNFSTIRSEVQALDYVKKAAVKVEPGGDVIIAISERKPIALLANMNPKMYVDSDGVLLPVLEGKIQDVPLLYGFKNQSSDTLKGEAFHQTQAFLKSAKTMPLCWITISEVAFNKQEGVVALSQENGVKLIFGTEDFTEKLQNWETFYTKIIRYKGINRMHEVDLRFKNQIVTKET